MKRAAAILTILMLFFTAQPLLIQCQADSSVKPTAASMTGCCGGNSCHKKEKSKKAENKDCDRTNACNPFAGCSLCHYVAVLKYFYASMPIQPLNSKIIPASEEIESGFIADCWHPPKGLPV